MITQLVRTKFESNTAAFLVFLAMNALMAVVLVNTGNSPDRPPLSYASVAEISVWLLLTSFIAAVLSLLRYNREKHTRLYAQLPVTSLEVRVAYWVHAALYLGMSSVVLLLVMFYSEVAPLDMLRFTLLYFFHGGALLAAISIAGSNSLRLIPEEVRRRSVIYFLLATVVTVLFLIGIGLVLQGYGHVMNGQVTDWNQLTLLVAVFCLGLVALDVRLFTRKDSYIG